MRRRGVALPTLPNINDTAHPCWASRPQRIEVQFEMNVACRKFGGLVGI